MKEFRKNYKYGVIALGVVLILSIVYVGVLRKAAHRYVVCFEEKYGGVEKEGEEKIDLYCVPGYHDLLKERGMLDGLVHLAQSDSVNLFLNIPEHQAQLMIKGLAVRTIALDQVTMDVLFRRASDEALYNWLSEPLQIVGSDATIAKEPVNVVVAPKDTTDEVAGTIPDTLQKEPVFFILETNRDLRILFYQTGHTDRWADFACHWKYRWQETVENMQAFFSFRLPEYTPFLAIGLNQEEARVLYRAIPGQGQIVITL